MLERRQHPAFSTGLFYPAERSLPPERPNIKAVILSKALTKSAKQIQL
jgi:hypothetical protein